MRITAVTDHAGKTMKYAWLMSRALSRWLAWVPCLGLAASCGQRQVEIIGGLPDGASPPLPCPASLADRLNRVEIPVEQDIAWQKSGYDQFPIDERVALAVQPNGQAQIAWLEVNPGTVASGAPAPPIGVHVTPLDEKLGRRGSDVVMPTGQEVSGLVAHDDGFALLTRDLNTGTPIDNGDGATLAYLVLHQNEAEAKVPLTGDQSGSAPEADTLYSPFLDGQLLWSGSTYGAYFVVEGGVGDPSPGFWRDVLVFRDSFGRAAPATEQRLEHGCDNNGGIRLIRDPGKTNLVSNIWSTLPDMTGLCVQQGRPGIKLTSLEADRPVSDAEVQWAGYSGAKLGSLLKIADGYLVYWLSLGDTNEHQGHDIRMARLDASFNVVSGPTWLGRTPGVEEWNLHVAPYGEKNFLMVYEDIAITGSALDHWAMYLGNFRGTHLVLLDAGGIPLPETDVLVPDVATTANAEPVLLGDDVAWPYVNPAPDYTQRVFDPNGPGQKTLRIARVRYCM